MRSENARALRWLDIYGISRASGVTIRSAVDACAHPTPAAMEELEAKVDLFQQLRGEGGVRASEALTLASGFANAIPMVGGILSRVYGGIAQVANYFEDMHRASCDKECAWPTSYKRRRYTGIDWPPSVWGEEPYVQGAIWLAQYMHDGIVGEGLGPRGTPDALGKAVGVYGQVKSDARNYKCTAPLCKDKQHKNINDHLRVRAQDRAWTDPRGAQPLMIPRGNPSKPWEEPGNNWYYRAWQARSLMYWMRDRLPCSALMCMHAIRVGTGRALDAMARSVSSSDQARQLEWARLAADRTGSRWYASLYYMHKDLWDMANAIGPDRTRELLDRILANSETKSRYDRSLRNPGSYSAEDRPYPWTQAHKELGFTTLTHALEHFASVAPGPAAPVKVYTIRRLPQMTLTLRPAAEAAAAVPAPGAPRPTVADNGDGLGRVLLPLGAAGAAVGLVWLLTRK